MSSKTFKPNPKSLDGVPDLCQLDYLEEDNVLHNLQYRYKQGKIYTSTTAKVLVAVNPYESVPGNDTTATMARYQQAPINLEGLMTGDGLEPHVFTVAHAAYHNMCSKKQNQSVIVCGESGSGKTESAKLFMKFLAYSSTQTSLDPKQFIEAEKIGKQILDANPILESFGNAKTILNNNSSRFGKFTKMLFGGQQSNSIDQCLIGAVIETYLLEKSRVVRQDKGERNYHVFYYLCALAAKHPEWQMGDGNPANFHYLNQSGCTTFNGDASTDTMGVQELIDAMNTLNISNEEQMDLFRCVAGILHLGNVGFKEGKKADTCTIANEPALAIACKLLKLDVEALKERLLTRTITMRDQVIVKPLSRAQAEGNRDSIAKALYNGIFLWVVERINQESGADDAPGISWIGTLDVFGFEIFEHNSFEQFCINFANERLQQFFNYHVLKMEQDLYRKEALIWTPVDLPENQDVIDLIAGRPNGILGTLDSACLQPKGNDEVFMANVFEAHKYHPRIQKVNRSPTKADKKGTQRKQYNGFLINHYAGPVQYDAKEFLLKNTDSAHPDTISVFSTSSCPIAAKVLKLKEGNNAEDDSGSRNRGQRFESTSYVFNKQLIQLMATLAETTPYFVRCIKPNDSKAPKNFIAEYVRPQLRCGGLVQALRILKCGFPTRCSYQRMYEMFGSILSNFKSITNLNKRDFTEAMIHVCGGSEKLDRSQYQLGLTMIFFRPGKQAFFQRILDIKPESISMLQRVEIHKFLIHKRIVRMRGAIRGAIRLKKFMSFQRFRKTARVMTVIGKTFFKSLRRSRKVVAWKNAEAENARLAADAKYQEALRAISELKLAREKEQELKRRIEAQKAAAETAQKEVNAAQLQMASFMERVKDLSKQLGEATRQQGQDAATKRDLERQLTEAEAQIQRLEAAQMEATNANKRNTEVISQLKADLMKMSADAENKQAELVKHLNAAQSDISMLKGELDGVRNELQRTVQHATQAKENANRTESELETSLNQEREAARATKSSLEASIRGLEQSLAAMTSKMAMLQAALTAAGERSDDKDRASQAAQMQFAKEKQRLEEEQEALRKRLDEEREEAREQIRAQKNTSVELEDALNGVRSQAQRLQDELTRQKLALSQDQDSFASQMSAKDEELSMLISEKMKALRAGEALKQELQELDLKHRQINSNLKNELASLEEKHKRSLEENEERIRSMKHEIKNVHEVALEELRSQLSDAMSQLARVRAEAAAALESERTVSQQQMVSKQAELEEANRDLEQHKQYLEEARNQLNRAKEQHMALDKNHRANADEAEGEIARLRRQVATASSQLETALARVTSLETELKAARSAEREAREQAARELSAARMELESQAEEHEALQKRSQSKLQATIDEMNEEKEAMLRAQENLRQDLAAQERKHQTELEEQARKLADREKLLLTQANGATTEEVEAWNAERSELEERVSCLQTNEDILNKELAKAKAEIRAQKRIIEDRERIAVEAERMYQSEKDEQVEAVRRMQKKFDTQLQDSREEMQTALNAAKEQIKSLQAEQGEASSRESVTKAEAARLRSQVSTLERHARQLKAKTEGELQAAEDNFKAQSRKMQAAFDRKVAEGEAKLRNAEDELARLQKLHRAEMEEVDRNHARASAQKLAAMQKEHEEQMTSMGEMDAAEQLNEQELCFLTKEEGYKAQVQDLAAALAAANKSLRLLTEQHEAAVADFDREREMLTTQKKVYKMQAVADAEASAIQYQRLIANAEADNRMLRTRLARLSSAPKGLKRYSSNKEVLEMHIEKLDEDAQRSEQNSELDDSSLDHGENDENVAFVANKSPVQPPAADLAKKPVSKVLGESRQHAQSIIANVR